LSGVDLKTGDKVLLIYNSANRDDEASVDPNVFDVGRTPKDYFGFGVP
jgi:cytochrome P450